MHQSLSQSTSATAWNNKDFRLVLLGKKHLNGASFTETYNIKNEGITGQLSVADIVRKCLAAVESQTDIPADLIEGVELRFIPKP